jgi:3-dehydroquinate dehydratase type I
MKLVATIYESTFAAALRAINVHCDMIELRAEHLGAIDLDALRATTDKPIILTYRGSRAPEPQRALDAGIDFIDVEWQPGLRLDIPRERVVLSHHDFKGFDLAPIAAMRAYGCAYTKLAVAPRTLAENFALLEHAKDITVIGMGEHGLFSRILAPFLGSKLTFVAATNSAAPGQLTLGKALAIYGEHRYALYTKHIFAIAGNPAGHSLSPTIHNPLFRHHGIDAAYTIASFETFDEIVADKRIRGLSITAPFKEVAMKYADRLGQNARAAGAINTLVRMNDGSTFGDNTDVDGFAAIIGHPKNVAIVGAGGTARAALVACERAGAHVRIFNRSQRELKSEPLENLTTFGGDLIIDTLPVSIPLPEIKTITARYPGGGEALLHAQAVRQNEIFREALK